MKKIGFIDYFLSEWHANNYPAWIHELSKKFKEEFQVAYAWAEVDISPFDGVSTNQWCEKYGVERCNSIQELCEKSDYILVLSPSNPEMHLKYAQEVFKYHKPTYIDKTFTPDYITAQKIYEISEKEKTPFFSTSALRYADEIQNLKDITTIVTTGGGVLMDEYIIHQIEMAVKVLEANPVSVKLEKAGKNYVAFVNFENGKSAVMNYGSEYPFTVHIEDKNGTRFYKEIQSDFFKTLLFTILEFYETKQVPFNSQQTLNAMKIREAIILCKEKLGQMITL